jgi:hypothetical protein
MKKSLNPIFILAILISASIYSCVNSSSEKKTESENQDVNKTSKYDYNGDKLVITDKILYDVPIVNEVIGDRSKNSPDWFWENLPTPDGDEFIKALLADARSGKLKTYYYDATGDYESFDAISKDSLGPYMDKVMSYEFETIDTTVRRFKVNKVNIPLDYKNVKKLRFLEEWFVAEGKFYKRVIAVAPFFTIEYAGMETVNTVFFWIMVDEKEKEVK